MIQTASYIALILLLLSNLAANYRISALRDLLDFQQDRLNDLETFRGDAEMYIAGRLVMAVAPDPQPGMP